MIRKITMKLERFLEQYGDKLPGILVVFWVIILVGSYFTLVLHIFLTPDQTTTAHTSIWIQALKEFLRIPGTLFIVLMALVTVVGVAIGAYKIYDYFVFSRIYTLDNALRRATNLLIKSSGKATQLRLLCFTPAIGNLTTPKQSEKFIEELKKWKPTEVDGQGIRIICLGETRLKSFYESYGRVYSKYRKKWKEAYDEAENLINEFRKKEKTEIKRKAKDFLPHYHYIVVGEKAILFVFLGFYPFFYKWKFRDVVKKFIEKEPESSIVELLKQQKYWLQLSPPENSVELFGIETKDEDVINILKTSFDFFWDHLFSDDLVKIILKSKEYNKFQEGQS